MEKKIICPFCCHRFHPNQAHFKFADETVTPDTDGVIFDAEELEKHGFVQRITYEAQNSDQRICPNCQDILPIGYGMRETVLISILGDARSGKSVYLTMLINELENNTDMASKLTFIGS